MARIPKKVEARIKDGVKKYSSILKTLRSKDINESDTVTIVSDMLSDIFGYDKYLDITSEYAIRNTYCDLAIKHNGEVVYLIECKAIGVTLKEDHLRQALEYSSTTGIDWCVLTNGHIWQVYKVIYGKPVRTEEVFNLDFIENSARETDFIEKIFMLCKEAISKSAIESFHEQCQLVNKFTISSLLLSDDSLNLVRRGLKKLSAQVKVDNDAVRNIIKDEIIKRDIMDSEEMRTVIKRVNRAMRKEKPRKEKTEKNTVEKPLISPELVENPLSSSMAIINEQQNTDENIVE